MDAIEEDGSCGEASLAGDEILALEQPSRDQRMNLNDSVFNLMLSQVGINNGNAAQPGKEGDPMIDQAARSDEDSLSEENGKGRALPLDEDGSPEALTRRDTLVLHSVRVVAICTVVLLSVFVVVFVFRFTYHAEDDAFRTEFSELAETVLDSFLVATREKVLMTKSVAEYVMGMPKSPLTISSSQFEKVVRPQQTIFHARSVAWSPLLRTNQDRISFEQHHSSHYGISSVSQDPAIPLGPYPSCSLCENATGTFENGEQVVHVPGFGNSLTCHSLQHLAHEGEIPSSDCQFVSSIITGVCHCTYANEGHNSPQYQPSASIFNIVDGEILPDTSDPPFHPIGLESSTTETRSSLMFNQLADETRNTTIQQMLHAKFPVMSEIFSRDSEYYQFVGATEIGPAVLLYYPILHQDESVVVGSISSEFGWRQYMQANNLPPKSKLLCLVVVNSCGQSHYFAIADGSLSELSAPCNEFTDIVVSSTYEEYDNIMRLSVGLVSPDMPFERCRYKFEVYPTSKWRLEFLSHKPRIYATFAGAIMGLTIVLFGLYDCFVRRRQNKLVDTARKSTALVASLFPKIVRNRLIEDSQPSKLPLPAPSETGTKVTRRSSMFASVTSLNYSHGNASFVREPKNESSSSPIAELYENTTVLFLDLAGFTAWSSEREPNEVFLLLETLYGSFDEAATRRGVFKIETIGDCYVAVTGIPDPMEDHALVMAKFAYDCMKRMRKTIKHLEPQLGPSTADLQCRVGMHSGPVTGGVLRGEKARFQLFGDTMNTAARMESTGLPGHIQASSFTADLIIKSGRHNWVVPRPDLVTAKGKGQLQTYWINPGAKRAGTGTIRSSADETRSENSSGDGMLYQGLDDTRFSKDMRLIDWTVDLLFVQLQKLVSARHASGIRPREQRINSMGSTGGRASRSAALLEEELAVSKGGGAILEEVSEVIEMPRFDTKAARKLSLNDDMHVEITVKDQLKEYVTRIASMHRDVPFHNFEHASHVAMTASKLLKRIMVNQQNPGRAVDGLRDAHSRTFGISSDPLMHFTLVFAALVHDVDHLGLRNCEMIQQCLPAAIIYKKRSVAEQNSLDVAWKVLMDDDFTALRECIYTNKHEFRRFRQLLVNAILATDLDDDEAQQRRQVRWQKAFPTDSDPDSLDRRGSSSHKTDNALSDSRATVLYEYIMQAADSAHAIQHWQTFSKFHERFFCERFTAFLNGDEPCDPSATWYEDQLKIFDEQVMPLAEKLRFCGIFGTTGEEFMRWAQQNRAEWAAKGKSFVRHMRDNVLTRYDRRNARQLKRRGSVF